MSGDLDWADHGACRDKPQEWWFPDPAAGATYTDPRALAVCADCPVLTECRAWGIAHEAHGVWGGLSARQRERIRRRSGLRLNTPTLIDNRPQQAVSMWRSGWTVAEIADELNVERRSVHRWLDAAGIDSTPPQTIQPDLDAGGMSA